MIILLCLKVLAVYTFTKRVNIEDGELRSRKMQGLFTVSHMNVVHIGKLYTWLAQQKSCIEYHAIRAD